MRALIYTIIGIITLGMISTAVLSQELYRPMVVQPKLTMQTLPYCFKQDDVARMYEYFSPIGSKSTSSGWMAIFPPGPNGIGLEFTFDINGCADSMKVLR
jgi:hypothetical protein